MATKKSWLRLFLRAIGLHPSVRSEPLSNPFEWCIPWNARIVERLANRPSWQERVGHHGECRARLEMSCLDAHEFFAFHDLYIPRTDGSGTTQIDHVVVSRFGVFVVETKNIRGWVFGDARDRQWTIVNFRKKHRIQNPLHQNRMHVSAVRKLLGLKAIQLYSVVYFVGDSEFKTELPSNVIDHGIGNYITEHQRVCLSNADVARCCQQLHQLTCSMDRGQARRQHLATIRQRSLRPS